MVDNKNLKYAVSIIILIAAITVIAIAVSNHGQSSPQTTSAPTSVPQTSTSNSTAVYSQLGPIYVNASANGMNATGSSSKPFKTIDQAISFAKPGSIVIVAPGTYNEDINITSRVMLEGSYANTTIINASGKMNGITVNGTAANGTLISNLTVENADNHGILVQDANNIQIMHNVVEHNGLSPTLCPQPPATPTGPCIAEDKPIELVGTSNVTVFDNMVTENMADGGIGVADLGFINPGSEAATQIFANATDNKIINNFIIQNKGGCGIVVASYNKGVIDNIVENNIVGFGVAGIVIATDTPNSIALNNVVENNTAFDNAIPGIIVHSNAPGDALSNTIVRSNMVYGNGADKEVGALNGTGIVVSGDVMPVLNTLIENNTVMYEYYGIWLRNANTTILSNNNVFNNVTVPQMSNVKQALHSGAI